MEREVVVSNSVPILVHSIGGVLPSTLLNRQTKPPAEIILVIPGNPGIGCFYQTFAIYLYEQLKIPVWVLGHGGHEHLPVPILSEHPHLYDLNGQVEQKKQLIATYLSQVGKLHLIGHSVGCWMIMQLLKIQTYSKTITSGFLIFPVFENLETCPNAAKIHCLYKYFKKPYIAGLSLLRYAPHVAQRLLANYYSWLNGIDKSFVPHVIYAVNPNAIRQVFFLLEDELKRLQARNNKLLRRNSSKLYFYYTEEDGYAPRSYYEQLIRDIPEIQGECVQGIQHCFVYNSISTMRIAKAAAKFIRTFK